MKKIVFFTNRMTKGGSERVISCLANELCKNYDVDIVTMTCAPSDYKLKSNVKHIALESEKASNNHALITNLKRFKELRRYISYNEKATYISFVTIPSYIILLLRNMIKGKIIVAIRNDPKASHKHLYDKLLVKCLYPKADGFIFQTKEAMDYYRNICHKKQVILPNPLDKRFDKLPFTIGGGIRRHEIVNVGRLIKQKNQKMLINAFCKILPRVPDFKLIIYGEGPLKEDLEKYICERGLKGKVLLKGAVHDLENRIYGASLFVLSSEFEGMPNALLEAMALGLPVISTDASGGGPRAIIRSGENGILVPTNDPDALADAILAVLCDQKFSEKIASNAHETVKLISSEASSEKWNQFISEVNGWNI